MFISMKRNEMIRGEKSFILMGWIVKGRGVPVKEKTLYRSRLAPYEVVWPGRRVYCGQAAIDPAAGPQ